MTYFETKLFIFFIYQQLIVNSDTRQIILQLRKRFLIIIVAIIAIIITYFSLDGSNFHYYYSDTTFIVNGDIMNMGSANYSLLSEEKLPPSTAENRLFAIFNSNALRDSLIYRLDLFNHYNIRTNAEFKYEKVLKKIGNLVVLKKVDNNLYKISVEDKERIMSAKVANETARLINVISKELMEKNLRSKILKYQSLIDTLSFRNNMIRKNHYEVLQNISPEDRHIIKIKEYIDENILMLKTVQDDNNKQIESYKFILNNYKQFDLNSITVLTKAIPDTKWGYDILGALLVCIYIALAVIGLAVVILLFINANKEYLMLFIKGE